MTLEVPDPEIIVAKKSLVLPPKWVEQNVDTLDFAAPLEVDGVTIQGLRLRGRTRKSKPDRGVCFQLEYHDPRITGGAVCRIEWRPINGHSNRGLGPPEHRHIIQNWSHHHPFNLNWQHSPEGVRQGKLPIAIPLTPDPANFGELLAIVAEAFRIIDLTSVTVPPWEPIML